MPEVEDSIASRIEKLDACISAGTVKLGVTVEETPVREKEFIKLCKKPGSLISFKRIGRDERHVRIGNIGGALSLSPRAFAFEEDFNRISDRLLQAAGALRTGLDRLESAIEKHEGCMSEVRKQGAELNTEEVLIVKTKLHENLETMCDLTQMIYKMNGDRIALLENMYEEEQKRLGVGELPHAQSAAILTAKKLAERDDPDREPQKTGNSVASASYMTRL